MVTLVSVAATPLAAVLSYFAGKKKRQNDFLQDLQTSIDMLAKKNAELLDELVKVKEQNVQLKVSVEQLTLDNEKLSEQVKNLTDKLENAKVTIKPTKS